MMIDYLEKVISLSTGLIAIFVSIFTLIFNCVNQRAKERKEKRVIPVVSILDNEKDNIEYRFKNSNMKARVFIDEQDIVQLNKQHYLYVCINNYYEYKMINCVVRNNLSDIEENVGVILPNKCVIIPLKIQKNTTLYVEIEYDTEENERLTYKLYMNVPSFSNRQDSLFCKGKKIRDMNAGLNISMSTEELLNKTMGLNLEKKE